MVNGLASFNSTNCCVLSCAFRTFRIVVNLVQAPLVERVFTQEMYGGKVHGSATCRTAGSLKDSRFAAEFLDLLFLGFSLCSIAFDKPPVLGSQTTSGRNRHQGRVYIRDLFSLSFNRIAKILFHHSHSSNGIGA